MVDGIEQNTTVSDVPFIMGNEARPNVLVWETDEQHDRIIAEHFGYRRLPNPLTHRRSVEFNKAEKYWSIDDELIGRGGHRFTFAFHLAPGISTKVVDETAVVL
jgi:hypothetical protein